MTATTLKISLASGIVFLLSVIPVLAFEPSYFVLGDSTASGTTPLGRKELRKDELEKKKVEYKLRLATLKDTRKQEILEKLTDKMARVNKKRIEHWRKVLARLEDILNRVKNKSSELKASGKDTSVVDSAVASASAQIALAKTAVDSQAARDYVVNIASESGLKINVGQAISGEQADLKAVYQTITEAHKAVSNAVRALKQLAGGTK